MFFHVNIQTVFLGKSHLAHTTLVRFLSCVDSPMSPEIEVTSKAFATQGTPERALSQVPLGVDHPKLPAVIGLGTVLALVSSLCDVLRLSVVNKGAPTWEYFSTEVADEHVLLAVYVCSVPMEQASGGEGTAAKVTVVASLVNLPMQLC